MKERVCKPCATGARALSNQEIQELMSKTSFWSLESGALVKVFCFKNYEETLAFVNRIAALAQQENHHPEMEFGYRRCRISLKTHACRGISKNDFAMAEQIDHLSFEREAKSENKNVFFG